jgi:hypothetical protein
MTPPFTSFMVAVGTSTVYVDSLVDRQGINYIGADTGSSNALAGALYDSLGNLITATTGMRVTLRTSNDITKGTACTFALSGGSAAAVVPQSNYANVTMAATTIRAGAMLDMIFDGTRWQVVGY